MTFLAAILIALSEIESNNNDSAVGKKGEVSRYQILPSTWHDYGRGTPYSVHPAQAQAKHVAQTIVICNQHSYFRATGNQPTPFDIYAMWNLGFEGYKQRHFSRNELPLSVIERADRFSNLVKEVMK